MEKILDSTELEYLEKLKNGIIDKPVIKVVDDNLAEISDYKEDLEKFRRFLISKGLNNQDISNFELVVKKKDFLSFLQFHKDNKCLAITNCFGFDDEISIGGKLRLMQKGIICRNKDNMTDFELHRSFYTNSRGYREYFSEFSIGNKISVKRFKELKKIFKAHYSYKQYLKSEHGYALPIDAMIKILTNNRYLGKSDNIKFSFGLTFFYDNPDRLGNFSLYISDEDVKNAKFYIECRNTKNSGSSGSCPPKIPCQ